MAYAVAAAPAKPLAMSGGKIEHQRRRSSARPMALKNQHAAGSKNCISAHRAVWFHAAQFMGYSNDYCSNGMTPNQVHMQYGFCLFCCVGVCGSE
jgi:hypothetical protein